MLKRLKSESIHVPNEDIANVLINVKGGRCDIY